MASPTLPVGAMDMELDHNDDPAQGSSKYRDINLETNHDKPPDGEIGAASNLAKSTPDEAATGNATDVSFPTTKKRKNDESSSQDGANRPEESSKKVKLAEEHQNKPARLLRSPSLRITIRALASKASHDLASFEEVVLA
ncbi:hypothetical protein OQA88_10365 [Cercophora sp. LCS_1]